MKKIFVIDWILIPAFMLCLCTGIGLHIAGHENEHGIWHNRAILHVATSLLFLTAGIGHIATHRGWYKGLIYGKRNRKSKTTAALSATFVFVAVTGIVLLRVEGANSGIGLWHYKAGLLTSALAIGHILKRIPILLKTKAIRSDRIPTHCRHTPSDRP